jgi:hypothetical protein
MNNIHLHIIGSESFFNLLDELNLNYTVSFDKNLKHKNQNFLVRIIFLEKVHLFDVKKYTYDLETLYIDAFNSLINSPLNSY